MTTRGTHMRRLARRLFVPVLLMPLMMCLHASGADASPFAIKVGTSSGNGSGEGNSTGGGAGEGRRGGATLGGGSAGVAGTLSAVGSGGPRDLDGTATTVSGSSSESTALDSALAADALTNGSLSAAGFAPYTGPFGSDGTVSPSTAGDISDPSAPSGSWVPVGSTIGPLAFIDLGDSNYLAVAGTVGQALADAVASPTPRGDATAPAGSYSFPTGGDWNSNGDDLRQHSALPTAPGAAGLPGLDGGLLIYPDPSLGSSPLLALDLVTAVPNPEPSTLVLLGTGMLLAARRYRRRP